MKSTLKQLYIFLFRKFQLVRQIRHFGFKHYCPICKSYLKQYLDYGPKRPKVRCPVCGSLERQRLVFLFLKQKNFFDLPKKVLHIAPEKCLENIFIKNKMDYYSADLSRRADVRTDLLNLCFPKESFDCLIANHVMEHIEEDDIALREIFRVLKNNGCAILQVPMKTGMTYENKMIKSPEMRQIHFGQSDHVRIYGVDFYNKLETFGFISKPAKVPEQRISKICKKIKLDKNEQINFILKP